MFGIAEKTSCLWVKRWKRKTEFLVSAFLALLEKWEQYKIDIRMIDKKPLNLIRY